MTDLLPAGNHVYANWGRWVVGCSRPFCFSAMQVYPGQTWVACGDCGEMIADLLWPADPEGVETVLNLRPDVRTRNWFPGETLLDLLQENAAHGVLPPGADPDVKQVWGRTADDRISGGLIAQAITSDIRRHALEGR